MAKIIDITDRLTFGEKPAIRIAGKKITVNDDAATVLKLLGKMGDGESDITPSLLNELSEMIFTPEGKEQLDALSLNFRDYSVVVQEAMNLIMAEEDEDAPKGAEIVTMTSSATGI